MKIERDNELRTIIMDTMREHFGKKRSGMHMSDTLSPRQSFWKKIAPMPPSDDEILYFQSGRAIEDNLLSSANILTKGVTKEWRGIKYSIDFHTHDGIPCELKSRRSNPAKDGEEEIKYEYYLRQLRRYCAVENSTKGKLVIFTLTEDAGEYRTRPNIHTYDIEFTDEELEQERENILQIVARLERSLQAGIPDELEYCSDWMCGTWDKHMLVKPKCETCGREFETDYGAKKHSEGKKTLGHVIVPAEYEWSFQQRCKWYQQCRGNNPLHKV